MTEANILAWENGSFLALKPGVAAHEAVLAVPLSRLLVKLVKVPAAAAADPAAYALPLLQAESPYPTDEPLAVGCEKLRETSEGQEVLAAALPESSAEDIASALDSAKLCLTRVDALALGALRGLYPVLGGSDGERRLLILEEPGSLALFVLDGDTPVALRALPHERVTRLAVTLALLEAEDFAGVRPLKEIVTVGAVELGEVAEMASVREIKQGEDAALAGVAERTAEPGALDVLPASWREVLEESRFKGKLKRNLAIAGGIWALVLLVLFGVPWGYEYLAKQQKELCREHRRQYEEVKEIKDKVELVQKYSDHSRGALEILKAVSDRLPSGVTLSSWSFKREEGVKVNGEADSQTGALDFKDQMAAAAFAAGEGEEPEKVFPLVKLSGQSASKSGGQRFTLECGFVVEEAE